MAALRLLVVEGNAAAMRRLCRSLYGLTPGERYAEELRRLRADARVDIVAPADDATPAPLPLAAYDGIAITGSALNAYHDVPEVRRQVEFARAVFAAGTPFFGSCWGLQIATVAAGGRVERNDRGREVAYARDIWLTPEGARHPMHAGRPPAFSAPAIHGDHVTVLPEAAIVTAANGVSPVQAAEIHYGGGLFWGTQYHPEYALTDIADVIARYGQVLVDEGNFETLDGLSAYVAELRRLAADPRLTAIAWRLGLGADILDPMVRLTEIGNWLTHAVETRIHERRSA
ncbi:type 1 glutamine amidotransferase [Ensifer soli]|uniref:type 1 glutamine amidotransferase n=1 Tax=Ciceribacter sp. sgz301302 TaxID=3342379 RepID=UPI0035B7C8A5